METNGGVLRERILGGWLGGGVRNALCRYVYKIGGTGGGLRQGTTWDTWLAGSHRHTLRVAY